MSDLKSYINIAANSVNSAGNIHASGSISSTGNITAGGNIDIDGDGQVGGNLVIVGNIDFSGGGTINQITSPFGYFTGNTDGANALYAGVPGGTIVPGAVAQFTGDSNAYMQINAQNRNHGTQASIEYVITGDLGSDTTDYLDIGFSSAAWDGSQENSLGTAVKARDGYMYVQGGGGGGNLVLGTTTAGRSIKFNAGGPNSANTVATIDANGFTATGNVSAGYLKGDGGNISNITAANITGLGNVALINTDGNSSNVLYGNGAFAAAGGGGGSYGDSNVVTLLNAFGSNTITTTGNVSVGNITATNIGNISSINKDGNASNILYGNGVFASSSSVRGQLVADTLVNLGSGSPLQITSSMYRIVITAGSSSSYTFILPDTNTCYVGQSFVFASTQSVTQNYGYTISLFGGGSSGQSWTAGTNIVATCVAQRGGGAEVTTNWKYSYQGGVGTSGTGAQLMSINPSFSGGTATGSFDVSGAYVLMSMVGEKYQTWSYTVGGVTAVPTAVAASGVFTIPSTAGMSTGQAVTITGTNGGTGSISGYTSGTTYYIIGTPAPTGATSITLSASRNSSVAITTTAGTLSGLTMTFGPQVSVNPYGQFGHIVNLTGTITANFDISFVSVNQSSPAYSLTIIINQGSTAYVPQNFYVGSYGGYVGTAATINWAGGVTPTGTPNKKDVITLSWLQNTQFSPTIVLGQLQSYG
jgi:hypothetical protein